MTFWEEDFLLGLSSRKRCDSPVQLVSSCGKVDYITHQDFLFMLAVRKPDSNVCLSRTEKLSQSQPSSNRELLALEVTETDVGGHDGFQGLHLVIRVPSLPL